MADHYHHEKKKMTYIVFAILVIVFGIVLWRVLKMRREPHDGEIHVQISKDEVVSKDLEFSATDMYPGEKREYTLILKAKDSANYSLVFGLSTDTASGSAFARFVSATIIYEGKERGTAALQEGFDGKTLAMTEWIEASKSIEITVVYEMSIDATDEVQGAAADFDFTLQASGTTKRE